MRWKRLNVLHNGYMYKHLMCKLTLVTPSAYPGVFFFIENTLGEELTYHNQFVK